MMMRCCHSKKGHRPDSVSSQPSIRSQPADEQRRNTGDQSGECGNQEQRPRQIEDEQMMQFAAFRLDGGEHILEHQNHQ